jgi:perosamine synthetase
LEKRINTMTVKKADLKYRSAFPYFDEEAIHRIVSQIEESLRTGVLANGHLVQEYEKKFCENSKAKYAVAVSSGGSSLEIALRYFGIQGCEVIVPTNTFVATPNSVIFAGGTPVFADILEDTLCVDPEDVERRISKRTVGVIVVHVAGLVCPQIYELKKICKDNNLFLIEDCAHAHGATIDQKAAGTIGDAGCFSSAPTKVITTGEGGMLLTNNSDLAEKARIMRNRGLNNKGLMVMLGHSWTMSEISASLGLCQIESLKHFLKRRNDIARKYRSILGKISSVSLFKEPSNILHSYHKFPIRLQESLSVRKVAKLLREKYGVETGNVYYPPCHLHPYYRSNFGTHEGTYPIAETVLRQVLCLPIHLALSDEDVDYVCDSLAQSIEKSKKGSGIAN